MLIIFKIFLTNMYLYICGKTFNDYYFKKNNNKINIELSTKIGNKSLSKLVGSKSYEIANGNYLND